ncbi:hypothetical protein Tco_1326779 [Tanacetum coccineum]
MMYQNLLREFWCTAITSHPNSPTDDSKSCPLKEYLIMFSVMNGKKPLTLNFKTLTESTRIDYAKGNMCLDTRPENCLSYGLENSVHICCSGIKVYIGDIIYNDLVTRLINKSKQKYVSCPRFVSCALKVLLVPEYTQDESFGSSPTILSNSIFSKDPSKVTPIELMTFMVVVNNNENALKEEKPKSKKTPIEAKVTPPPVPTKDSEQSHLISLGHIPDPQDLERNKQLTGTGLPSTQLDEGTRKLQLFPEGTRSDPKDSVGNKQPIDTGLPSTVFDEGTINNTPLPEGTRRDKDLEGLKPPTDMEPLTTPVTEQSLQLKTFADSPSPNKEQPGSSNALGTNDSDADSSSCPPALKKYDNTLLITERQLKHKEAIVSYADLRASIKGYHEENVDHQAQTNKLVQSTIDCVDRTATDRTNLLTTLNRVIESFKVIQVVVKDDLTKDKKLLNALRLQSSLRMLLTFLMKNLLLTLKGGGNVAIEDDTEKTNSAKAEKEPTNAVPISIVKPIETLTSEVPPITTIISTSQPERSQVPQREEKGIATNKQLKDKAKLKEDKIKKAAEEAKMLEMTKTEVIKVVREEAEKIRLDLKKILN